MAAKPNTLTFGNLMERWVSLAGSAASISRATRNPQKHSRLQEKVDASDLIAIGTRCLIGASVHRGAICISVELRQRVRGVESAEQS